MACKKLGGPAGEEGVRECKTQRWRGGCEANSAEDAGGDQPSPEMGGEGDLFKNTEGEKVTLPHSN